MIKSIRLKLTLQSYYIDILLFVAILLLFDTIAFGSKIKGKLLQTILLCLIQQEI